MGKTIPLLVANIKGFLRNWKTLVLLLGIPLVLITVIFLSFSSTGLRKVNVGIVDSSSNFSIMPYTTKYFTFMVSTQYPNRESCINALKDYREYACIVSKREGNNIKLSV